MCVFRCTPCQTTQPDAAPGTLGAASHAAPSALARKQDRQPWRAAGVGADRPMLGVPDPRPPWGGAAATCTHATHVRRHMTS
eukprot:8053908-Alexandrium_andersonii.AAC.1